MTSKTWVQSTNEKSELSSVDGTEMIRVTKSGQSFRVSPTTIAGLFTAPVATAVAAASSATASATTATTQAGIATTKAAEALASATAAETAADRVDLGDLDAAVAATAADAVATAADRVQTGADRSAAVAARIAADAAAVAAALTGPLYANEATGRAAVADGAIFLAVGATDAEAVDIWQRVNSTTSTRLRPISSAKSTPLQLFPDPYFDVSAGDASRRFNGRLIFDATYNNRVWVPDYSHSMGVGAWRVLASSSQLGGYNIPFGGAITTDDSVGVGIIVKAAAGTSISIGARFVAIAPTSWVGAQYGGSVFTATGGEDLVTVPVTAIPAGATGVSVYVVDGATAGDINVLAVWGHLNAAAGSRPSPRLRADAVSWVQGIRGGERMDSVTSALKPLTVLTNSGDTVVQSATSGSVVDFGPPFAGWGDSYTTPGAISFNAVRLPAIYRSGTAKWSRVRAVVRADTADPKASTATVVAIGDVYVDEDATTFSDLLIVLRDPLTGAVKTITQADLSTYFSVAYYPYQRDGTPAYAKANHGTIGVSGLTRQASFYVTDTRDPVTSTYSSYSGNATLAIGLDLLTSPVEAVQSAPTAAFLTRLGITAAALTSPSPMQPTLAPRIFGMVGREVNVYLGSSHSTARELGYDVTCTLGKQQDERWTHTPSAIADNVAFQLDVVDPDQLTVLGTTTATIDVASATAAAGANKRVLVIGDSTTDAGTTTQRLLDVAAANTSAVQITLIGTRGSGANKHEGRGGWSLASYWDQDTVSGVDNPFVTGAGNKFDMATYLSATGQSAPHVVVWHLGINDVFSATSDGAVNSIMTTWLDRIRRMIGITADATVGSVIEANASAANIVAMPIMPAGSQDAFGQDYANGQTWRRYRRNIALASYRIRQDLGALEGSKIYLLPWNVTVDPVWGFPATVAAVNSTASDTTRRLNDGVHPATAGYQQMGDSLYACVNWLAGKGHI